MEEFIEHIAKRLVNNPDQVRVDKHDDEEGRERYLLYVTPPDRGKIIGRQGRTIKAFRILVGAVAARQGRRVSFDIVDDARSSDNGEEGDDSSYNTQPEGE